MERATISQNQHGNTPLGGKGGGLPLLPATAGGGSGCFTHFNGGSGPASTVSPADKLKCMKVNPNPGETYHQIKPLYHNHRIKRPLH